MTRKFKVGDRVKLLEMPDSLIHDLPREEQEEMLSFVGQSAVIEEIDAYGYFWMNFGFCEETEEGARCWGHSFCVTEESITLDQGS